MPHAVLTRDPADAQGYAAALAPLGLDVVALPVTRIAPAADPDALRRAVAAGGYAAIVIASPRAAHELARARDAAGAELPEVWAVGAATKRALAIAHIAATHPDGVASGAELARRVVAAAHVAGKRVLVPRAEDGRPEPAAILRAAGALVDDVVAYRTVATPADDPALAPGCALLRARAAAVVCVFAPSQVAALAALVDVRALGCPVAVIGDTTADAARAAGIPAASLAVAAAPTPEGIANAVAAVYRSPS
jgi:uroporphyrinogen-III synthase|nr:uroporphyrinogen-III synthase [Kofleriaceae bacterium]